MRLILLHPKGQIDITQLVSRVTWSGALTQVARKLEFEYLVSSKDKNIPVINIAVGNHVIFYGDYNEELFRGIVFTKEKSNSSDTAKIMCYDKAIYLLKNEGAYNFKNTNAEKMTRKICSDFGIPCGYIEATGINQNRICIGESLYEIIMKGYSYASVHTGEKYMPIMLQDKLSIMCKGERMVDIILENSTNIINATYSESLENVVNAVQILDSKDKVVGKVVDADSIKQFGKFQKIYKKSDNVLNAQEVANSMLKDFEQTGTIEAIGNSACITGFCVLVRDKHSGLYGSFYIDGDSHTWESNMHTMNLTLNFENIMDMKDIEQVAEKTKKAKKGKKKAKKKVKVDYNVPLKIV